MDPNTAAVQHERATKVLQALNGKNLRQESSQQKKLSSELKAAFEAPLARAKGRSTFKRSFTLNGRLPTQRSLRRQQRSSSSLELAPDANDFCVITANEHNDSLELDEPTAQLFAVERCPRPPALPVEGQRRRSSMSTPSLATVHEEVVQLQGVCTSDTATSPPPATVNSATTSTGQGKKPPTPRFTKWRTQSRQSVLDAINLSLALDE
eukprot:TRINITY_DN14466_c0_g1_i1.p1 TRINITY_DN14466_c0_g1~~TRINITY_DN14466_c0_g1_i1.p1  ORF type:complete len:222 (+),score=26.08 TRINITY_DN14466_c0_g1_i1:40-666(+)